ncbi:MAG: sialate O-acetylesterase [Verrucomicrobiota bacterium]
MKKIALLITFSLLLASALRAELKMPAIFGDHMVLQQKQPNPIWGWDTPGTEVTVSFAGQTLSTKAGSDGKWTVKLAPLPANATPQTLTIVGSIRREIRDVLVGEVWLCSGQSNMGFKLEKDWNGDLEAAAAKFSGLRLISVPNVGTQDLQSDFKGEWKISTPETALKFSAVGFLYGRYLHEILNVPVGLIDNAWGGSAAEAWVRRSALENDPRFKQLIAAAVQREAELLPDQGMAELDRLLAQWRAVCIKAGTTNPPWQPQNYLTGNQRTGNLFAGVLHPIVGFGLKGVIWYQGESNAGRAYECASLFPFMIVQWRKEWAQGEFPFYWVQLANFSAQAATPMDSAWAELREAQTKTLQLTNTGQAVIIDLGEGKDIHPRNKHDVAARLVRWALVKDYGMKLPFRSPEFQNLTINSNKAIVTIDCFGSKLRPFGVEEAKGFAVCGADKVWHWATGKIVGGNKVEVWSDAVASPSAVRYAWCDNPVCNLYSNDGLPVTPFRTDGFEMITKPKPEAQPAAK